MKRLVYRDICGSNPRKREVSIEEICDRRFSSMNRKWTCKYFVRDRYLSEREEDLNQWVEKKRSEGCRRNCHVLRTVDSRTGTNKVICKVLGEFFVVWGGTAFDIVYVNKLRILQEREPQKRN
jgi:hypothetical protein